MHRFIVYIHEITASDMTIMQVDPCEHGLQHQDADGNFLGYSCRKIRVVCIE